MPRQRWDSFAGFRLEDPTYTPKKAPPRATSAPRRPAAKRSLPASRQPSAGTSAPVLPKYRPLPADSIKFLRAPNFAAKEPVPKATLLDLAALVDLDVPDDDAPPPPPPPPPNNKSLAVRASARALLASSRSMQRLSLAGG